MRCYFFTAYLSLCVVLATASPTFAGSCFTAACHKAIADLKNLHQPVKEEECLACHIQRTPTHPILGGGKSFELTAKGSKLCEQCHAAMGQKKVVHGPVKDGNCLSCHKPHGANGPFLLDVEEDQTALCLGCHDKARFKANFMHGPVAAGACTKCHNPHESSEKSLLSGNIRDMCLKCHEDFAKAMEGAPIIHPPVKDDPCTACHNPHGSAFAHVLNKKMPDLCLECHDAVDKKLKGVKTSHKPIQQEGSCGNCHSPHFSKAKGLLPYDEQIVCLGCHGNDGLGKPPLSNIRKELDGKKDLHEPVKKGQCGKCHDPHGSEFAKILRGPYPADFYAPYKDGAYDFCLSCHDKDLLRFPETTIYTKFRNGKQNLHYVHVVNKRKGRTCRACHEPHAGNGQKLVGKEGPHFGDWKIPSRFLIAPAGGSCAPGCHRKFSYDRENPVDYNLDDKK